MLQLCHFASVNGQSTLQSNYLVNILDINNGLLSNFVTKTISDENNFKYFATEGGLSFYDGYEFKSIRPGSKYEELESENIETLFRDTKNQIWIGTKGGGITVLNPLKNTLKSYNDVLIKQLSKKPRIVSICQDNDGNIWIGTWSSGLIVIDPDNKKVKNYYPNNNPIYQIIQDKYHNMWYLAGNVIYKFDPSENRTLSFEANHTLYNMVEDTIREKIWISGNKGASIQLKSYNFNTQKLENHDIGIKGKYAKSIALDSKNRVWIGSWGNGLFISDELVNRFQLINTTPTSKADENVNYTSITDISIDKNDIAWLSTAYGGVVVLYPNKGFEWIKHVSRDQNYDKNAISLYQDKNGNIYKGTLTEGLYVKKAGDQFFEKINEIPNAKINVIYEKSEYLFIGTAHGLYIIKDKNFSNINYILPTEKVVSILLDKSNRLWIGTQERGLRLSKFDEDLTSDMIYFSESTPEFLIDNNRISKIVEDEKGNIWLGTYAGINLYDEINQKILNQQTVLGKDSKNLIVNDIFVDKDAILCATPQGLLIVKTSLKIRGDEKYYQHEYRLKDDFLCAVQKDINGALWMSSSNTLIKYDLTKNKLVRYSKVDGIVINSFHIASSIKDMDGLLYFGGSNGIIQFDPANISTKSSVPDVIFTKMLVNNEEIGIDEKVNGNQILKNSLNNTKELKLSYLQNNLTFSFAVNDILGEDKINYQYSMDRKTNRWIDLGKNNEVNFTNLQPDKYYLAIRASRNNQDWSEIHDLTFTVATPPWLSWYAFVIYGLIIISIIVIINRFLIRQAKLQGQLEIIRIEKEKEHELNEAKLIFFTNISHEFKTPLTLILSPVLELLKSFSVEDGVKDRLLLIEKNAKKMLKLINQLIDFRKSEHDLLKLNLQKNDIIPFVQKILNEFTSIAKEKNIKLKFESDLNSYIIEYDSSQLEIVMNNLISNALKFTNSGGVITINILLNTLELLVLVKDTGIGLSENDKNRIFDRFYQVDNHNSYSDHLSPAIGSGIGLTFSKKIIELHNGNLLVESEKGKGSVFKIVLPIVNEQNLPSEAPLLNVNNQVYFSKDEYFEIFEQGEQEEHEEVDQNVSILIVDDNEGIRKYLSTLLSNSYQIYEAYDGLNALEIINSKHPDLIVCDVMMPNMDGIQLCSKIKKQISTSHIPIILLTARASDEFQLEGLNTGADDYITKPFNPEVVKTRIANILHNRSQLREYYYNKLRFEPDIDVASDDSNLDHDFINKAIELVNANILNPEFGTEDLMTEFHMSRSTLFRKVKALTGLSLTGFIKTVKLKKAAQLILQTDMKLSQVAYEAGFNDYKYFKLSFKQQFSCLPSEYRTKTTI
jgi:signal transduction histidine kinase/ligand-binding sensor domain-containing protein/CheY-like chemotaxis protein/AraC-like DNA-binding protein